MFQEIHQPHQEKEGDAGDEGVTAVHYHLGIKAVSRLTGKPYTEAERRDIIEDAIPPEPFGSAAKTPVREYGPDDEIPFGD
ncbi:MAG TPA: hypothetical protein VM535_00515 [Candidatus Saccharimonadales bacterium]|nr:hypothetical protein [Candidatus Saccharimonadales bacterium]